MEQKCAPYTRQYQSIQSRIITPAYVMFEDAGLRVNAIWDTGATGTSVSSRVVEKLGLTPTGQKKIVGLGGVQTLNRYVVDIQLPNKAKIKNIPVISNDAFINDADMLIGMDIISCGDFAISNLDGKTTFSFRMPSMEIIDFTKRR